MAALEGLASWGPAAALSGEGSLTAGSGVPGVSLSGQGSLTVGGPAAAIRVAAIAGTVIVSEGGAAADSISVVRQADIGEVGERASRGGLAALTAVQWLLAAVILIAAVYPFLPPQVQAEIQGEAALVAAIAAVLAIIKRLHVPDL
jgi:hypothetical protein